MSKEGSNMREVGQETTTGFSIFPQCLETDNFVLEDAIFNYFNPSSSSDISPLHHHHQQQQGPSTGPVSQNVPSSGGELEKSFQVPISRPELSSFQDLQRPDQFRNEEMGGKFEELFDVALPPSQGTITGFGSSSYHLPMSNSTSELIFQPSQTVQPPSMPQGYSQNPHGAALNASSSPFPRTQTQTPLAENHNFQKPKSGQGKKVAKDKTQSNLLSSFYPLAMAKSTQNQVPNTEQQRFLGTKPTPNKLKIGGSSSSSSRNVMMEMTLPDNVQQLAPIQVDNPPTMLDNIQQMSPIQVGNRPNNNKESAPTWMGNRLPLQPNNQQLTSNQVDNLSTLSNNGQQSSSSRNVRMKMTLSDDIGTLHIANNPPTLSNNNQQLASIEVGNQHHFPGNDQQLSPIGIGNPPVLQNNDQQLAPIQFGSFRNPSPEGNENPPRPTRAVQNSLYDPIYEQLGFPVDLTLRMYLASKRNRGDDS